MGRPRFQPTTEQRKLVKSMAAIGAPHEDITELVGIHSPKTLRRHFRLELDRGAMEANVKVRQTLYQMATSGKHPGTTLFWAKTRLGWRERGGAEAEPVSQAEGAVSGPMAFEVSVYQPPRSPEDQAALDELTRCRLAEYHGRGELCYERLAERGESEQEEDELPPDLAQKAKERKRRKEERL